MVKIDPPSFFTHVTRRNALEILGRARLYPDRFTAHRNGTFTARYLRDKEPMFQSHEEYEGQLEEADQRVAILKRPSPKLDRGRYVTLQFSFAAIAL